MIENELQVAYCLISQTNNNPPRVLAILSPDIRQNWGVKGWWRHWRNVPLPVVLAAWKRHFQLLGPQVSRRLGRRAPVTPARAVLPAALWAKWLWIGLRTTVWAKHGVLGDGTVRTKVKWSHISRQESGTDEILKCQLLPVTPNASLSLLDGELFRNTCLELSPQHLG